MYATWVCYMAVWKIDHAPMVAFFLFVLFFFAIKVLHFDLRYWHGEPRTYNLRFFAMDFEGEGREKREGGRSQ